jgi:hypothetical protein
MKCCWQLESYSLVKNIFMEAVSNDTSDLELTLSFGLNDINNSNHSLQNFYVKTTVVLVFSLRERVF